jgi:MerR family transcriptional regulator, light-induced transcriptional regulator
MSGRPISRALPRRSEMSELMVSAGEAARRLGVAPATIQRWVDSGVIHAERTPGGHRRIYVTELRRLIAASRPAQLSGPVADWLETLMTGDPAKVKAALLASRQETGSWAETADEVASAIAEIGRAWEAGGCRIFEEHAATEALRRGAASCASEMGCAGDAPRAALFTVEGERHTLGLSLAELVLLEAGWRPQWIGEGPPADELGLMVEKFKPDALVVSASAASTPAAVARYQPPLSQVARKEQLKLILAGGGAWQESLAAKRVVTFKELREALA